MALALFITLGALLVIPDRLLVLIPLLLAWAILFYPLTSGELVLFVLAALFFLFQNYVTLKAGLFEFRFKDILLMPYYEPLLWGFYFTSMKRFIPDSSRDALRIGVRSVVGVVVTSVVFSVFSYDSNTLLMATLGSTAFLLVLFHDRADWYYAGFALALGLIVELFGVSTGLWSYPDPDFLGVPYWFATMWISVGVLGRRFLVPAAEWLAGFAGQKWP